MTRRAFIGILGFGLLAQHQSADAQAPAKTPRIGWLSGPVPARRGSPSLKAFTEGLQELGYVIGQNVILEVRTPGDRVEQYPDLAARLVAEGVDVILAVNPYSIEAVTKVTRTIPVVALDAESDPVDRGWVVSLSRPSGNLTGFFLDFPEVSGKQLQLLKEVKPSLARVAVLGDARVNQLQFRAIEAAARGTAMMLQALPVKNSNEIQGAIVGAAQQGAGALVALTSPLINTSLDRIADIATKHGLPAICFYTRFAEVGGLLTYGADFRDLYRRAGGYVARILKGTKPGELPVQRPTKFELVIELKTARVLGLTIPPSLLLRADRVIE